MYGCIFKSMYELKKVWGMLSISHGFGMAVLMDFYELKRTVYRENGKRSNVMKHGSHGSSLTPFRMAALFIVCMASNMDFNRMLLCWPAQ